MSAKTFDVNKAEFTSEVLQSDQPVLVDFWAEWCPPCKMLEPIVDEIASEYQGKLRVARLNTDFNPEIQMQYGIMGIPTLILFKGGEPVERITGFKPKAKIVGKIESYL